MEQTAPPQQATGYYAAPESGVFGLAMRTGLLSLVTLGIYRFWGLCCTNPVWDSSCESSVVAVRHEQTHTPRLQDQELAIL
jgi:hypothetical protein